MAKNIGMKTGPGRACGHCTHLPWRLKSLSPSACLRLFAVETAGFVAWEGAGGRAQEFTKPPGPFLIGTPKSGECGPEQPGEDVGRGCLAGTGERDVKWPPDVGLRSLESSKLSIEELPVGKRRALEKRRLCLPPYLQAWPCGLSHPCAAPGPRTFSHRVSSPAGAPCTPAFCSHLDEKGFCEDQVKGLMDSGGRCLC